VKILYFLFLFLLSNTITIASVEYDFAKIGGRELAKKIDMIYEDIQNLENEEQYEDPELIDKRVRLTKKLKENINSFEIQMTEKILDPLDKLVEEYYILIDSSDYSVSWGSNFLAIKENEIKEFLKVKNNEFNRIVNSLYNIESVFYKFDLLNKDLELRPYNGGVIQQKSNDLECRVSLDVDISIVAIDKKIFVKELNEDINIGQIENQEFIKNCNHINFSDIKKMSTSLFENNPRKYFEFLKLNKDLIKDYNKKHISKGCRTQYCIINYSETIKNYFELIHKYLDQNLIVKLNDSTLILKAPNFYLNNKIKYLLSDVSGVKIKNVNVKKKKFVIHKQLKKVKQTNQKKLKTNNFKASEKTDKSESIGFFGTIAEWGKAILAAMKKSTCDWKVLPGYHFVGPIRCYTDDKEWKVQPTTFIDGYGKLHDRAYKGKLYLQAFDEFAKEPGRQWHNIKTDMEFLVGFWWHGIARGKVISQNPNLLATVGDVAIGALATALFIPNLALNAVVGGISAFVKGLVSLFS